VDDAARGHVLAMEKGRPGEAYILAGPAHTLVDVFQAAERVTGMPAPRRHVAPVVLKSAAALLGAVNTVLPVPPSIHPEVLRAGSGVTYLGDDAKARRELGYDPRPLEAGLRETLEYEKAQLGSGGSIR
jgi:nucleoside-diphosphate-sugar epimerase